MRPTIALIIPLGDMPPGVNNDLPGFGRPVDPGYGIGAEHPSTGPVRPERPVDPGWGQGRPMPPTVGGGPILPPGIDNSLPPGVMPPIALPTPPGPPPTIWPPAGSVMPPIALPPHTPDNSLPKPAPGYIVAWVPGYGFAYVKLGMDVANPIAPGGPVPAPKQ